MEKETISRNTLKLLEQIRAKQQRYKVVGDKKSNRSLDKNPTLDNMYEVLSTLIKDLQEAQILGKK